MNDESIVTNPRHPVHHSADLGQSKIYQENVVCCAPLAIYCVDNDGIITVWNELASKLFGWTDKEIIGKRDPTIPKASTQQLNKQNYGDQTGTVVKRKSKQGGILDVMIWASPIVDDRGKAIGMTVMATQEPQAEILRDLAKTRSIIDRILENEDINIWSNDLQNKIGSYSSQGASKIFGYPAEMFENDPMLWRKLVHPEDGDYVDSIDLHGPAPVKAEFRIIHKDGDTRWVAVSIYPQFDNQGVPILIEGITVDITEHKEYQRQLHELAYMDFLTSLPNRHKFDKDFALATAESRVSGKHMGLLYVDFDAFKNINDTFGHQIGDVAIKLIANELHHLVHPVASVYRMGGDEFTILVRDIQSEHELETIAASILNKFQYTLPVEEEKFALHCSIGIATYPQTGESSDLLLREADMAMYRAKEKGGNQYTVFSQEMASKHTESINLYRSLMRAISEKEFCLYYQPKTITATGNLCGMEALIRWQSPNLGMVSPDVFIPYAEESGMIWEIGNWVLETACHQNKQWQSEGLYPLRISVNVSVLQLEHPNFSEVVEDVLQKSQLDPCYLELEITESVLVQNLDVVTATIDKITALGVHVSVDDFGVGYSSLNYLANLSVGTVKIDRSFVRNIESSRVVSKVITGIVQMAHNIGMKVIAEGVEYEEQLAFLKQCQCDQIQGFLISRPLPQDKFEEYYRKNNQERTLEKG